MEKIFSFGNGLIGGRYIAGDGLIGGGRHIKGDGAIGGTYTTSDGSIGA